MSLHPIKALGHVIDEYTDCLRTEFRAKFLGYCGSNSCRESNSTALA
ncbi:MAG: hypothetical protein ABSG53_22440 [Thermoguttaceae bacterium]